MPHNARFTQFISKHAGVHPLLPVVHVTRASVLPSVIQSRTIRLAPCTVYKEELTYFFYGKPAYRVGGRRKAATKVLGDAAICFVFDLLSLPPIYRNFALDTGAYFGKRYDDFLPRDLTIEDFQLPPEHFWLSSLVEAFFGTNRNYFSGNAKPQIDHSPLDFASESYKNLLQCVSSTMFDERACTCEVQFNVPVDLASSKLMTMIMPDVMYDDVDIKKFLADYHLNPILYRMRRAFPEDRTEIIIEKIGDYYEIEGLM